jgi:thiamine biosynthesis lipoprotein
VHVWLAAFGDFSRFVRHAVYSLGRMRRICRKTVTWVALGICALCRPLPIHAAMRSARTPRERPRLFSFTHAAMATVFTLYLYSDDAARASSISDEAFDEIDRVEQLLSNYRESSELSRIDRGAGSGPVTTDPEMMDFLTEAAYWSRASDGAFDITVGRLMKAWGFYGHEGTVAPADELERLRAVTGWQKVELDQAARTVRFAVPGMELDPGGIGKGFAVDAAVRVLRADGVRAALLSAGSSTLYGLGSPPGRRGWPVVIAGPLPSKRVLSVMMLRDESLSSADCSKKNFVRDGHMYCHIMDPRTMRPVETRIQVSVTDPSATASDALSNVVFVEAPEQSLRTLAAFAPRARALIVSGEPAHPLCTLFRWDVLVDSTHCRIATTRVHRTKQARVQ